MVPGSLVVVDVATDGGRGALTGGIFFSPRPGEWENKRPITYIMAFFSMVVPTVERSNTALQKAATPTALLDTNISWLPKYSRDPISTLASLQTCAINLDRGCDFLVSEKKDEYMRAWRNPAPPHCQMGRVPPANSPIYADRLGVPRECDRVAAVVARESDTV